MAFGNHRLLAFKNATEGLLGTVRFTEETPSDPSRVIHLTMGWFDWLDADRPLTIAVTIDPEEVT